MVVKPKNLVPITYEERTVADVIHKVTQWRSLYSGVIDKENKYRRLSLEEAALYVQVSKKSLDDYQKLLISGRNLGYDFNTFKNEKINHLRKFVKQHKD